MVLWMLVVGLVAALAVRGAVTGRLPLTWKLQLRGAGARWVSLLLLASLAVGFRNIFVMVAGFLLTLITGLVLFYRQEMRR